MATERQQRNLALVREGFDAYARGDIATVLALTDRAVEIHMPRNMPNGGTFHGHDGYLLWIERWLDVWEEFTVDVAESEAVGERHVVSRALQSGKGQGSGVTVEMEVFYLNEIVDGKFTLLHLYPDREQAMRVAAERERE
jgi:uncharacterized protein